MVPEVLGCESELMACNQRARRAARAVGSALRWLLLGAIACEPATSRDAPEAASVLGAGVLNGTDDRSELYELERREDRETLARGVAALMWAHRVDPAEPGSLRANTAGAALQLCPDEPFAEQPSAAFCSATLIDDDLVLTAGHCLGATLEAASARCQRVSVVFGYHYSEPGRLGLASGDDVYACRRVVYLDREDTALRFSDAAILQLERRVDTGRAPIGVATDAPREKDALLAAAHGAGLPLKLDGGGRVVEVSPNADYLVASTDSFAGGSGGPLFSPGPLLVGFQARGEPDWEFGGDCFRARHSDEPNEQHQLVAPAIRGLCESGWPSERLCGRATECGDGACTGSEGSSSCPEDCPAPGCGDALCERSERAQCAADCRAYVDVPAEWAEDPATFGALAPPPAENVASSGGCRIQGARGPAALWSLACSMLFAALRVRRKARSVALAAKRYADGEPFRRLGLQFDRRDGLAHARTLEAEPSRLHVHRELHRAARGGRTTEQQDPIRAKRRGPEAQRLRFAGTGDAAESGNHVALGREHDGRRTGLSAVAANCHDERPTGQVRGQRVEGAFEELVCSFVRCGRSRSLNLSVEPSSPAEGGSARGGR